MNRFIFFFSTCFLIIFVFRYPFTVDQSIAELDWQVYIRNTAKLIIAEQSPKKLLEVRSRLYDLLTHCIPCDLIFKGLLQELVKNCDLELKTQIATTAAEYEHRMHHGSKAIFHLEAFVARFMAIYKKFMENSLGAFL